MIDVWHLNTLKKQSFRVLIETVTFGNSILLREIIISSFAQWFQEWDTSLKLSEMLILDNKYRSFLWMLIELTKNLRKV